MKTEDKFAKLLALAIIYEKEESKRMPFVTKVSCNPKDLPTLLDEIQDQRFKAWVASVSHLFKQI